MRQRRALDQPHRRTAGEDRAQPVLDLRAHHLAPPPGVHRNHGDDHGEGDEAEHGQRAALEPAPAAAVSPGRLHQKASPTVRWYANDEPGSGSFAPVRVIRYATSIRTGPTMVSSRRPAPSAQCRLPRSRLCAAAWPLGIPSGRVSITPAAFGSTTSPPSRNSANPSGILRTVVTGMRASRLVSRSRVPP